MRKFYIIGHNPNLVADALAYLDKGANALAPDVCYHVDKDDFYLYDKNKFWERWNPFKKKPRLTEYLSGLSNALKQKPRNLALIAFDLKGPYYVNDDTGQPLYDLNRLYEIIRTRFSIHFPQVAILTTVASYDGYSFLQQITGNQRMNEAVGIDENTEAEQADACFKNTGLSYTYANGTSAPVSGKTFAAEVSKAVKLRDAGNSFKLVYVWTLESEDSMKAFLDLNVDGILVNKNNIGELAELLKTQYARRYEIAEQEYNPFFKII